MSTYRQELSYSPSFFTVSKPAEEIKRFALGVDFDGCTDIQVARAKLSDDVANFVVDHPEIEELDVIISSLRQTLLLDYSNAHHNEVDEQGRRQSCTTITESFLDDVKWKIRLLFEKNRINRSVPNIRFHPLLLSDIYYGLNYGTTFGIMDDCEHYTYLPLDEDGYVTVTNLADEPAYLAYYNEKEGMLEDVWERPTAGFEFADTSKCLLLWTQMQYFAQNVYQPGQPFTFRFVDDNPDIIEAVTLFFKEYPHLVPENCSLETMYMSSNYAHYSPETPKTKPSKVVTGIGVVTEEYRTVCSKIALHVVENCDQGYFSAKEAMVRELLLEWNPRPEHTAMEETRPGA